ncbi:hypothetical protein BHM03_00000975 [Ensete ventricosum]|nr:hypothetical protein BHM03_00000975 [Ensete ventricosum]
MENERSLDSGLGGEPQECSHGTGQVTPMGLPYRSLHTPPPDSTALTKSQETGKSHRASLQLWKSPSLVFLPFRLVDVAEGGILRRLMIGQRRTKLSRCMWNDQLSLRV